MNRFTLIVLVLAFVSCSTQKQLQKTFIGYSVSALQEKFGSPLTVLEQDDGKVYVFEILKKLESTEVSQGKLTLDPIMTPKVNKTERYYFTVKDDKVVKTRFEEEYER